MGSATFGSHPVDALSVFNTPRPLRLVVLAPERFDGADSPSRDVHACEATWRALKPWVEAGGRLDWCGPLWSELPSSVVQHPECASLGMALREVGANGQADVGWIRIGHWLPAADWLRLQATLGETGAEPRIGLVSPLSIEEPWLSPVPAALRKQLLADQGTEGALNALGAWLAEHAPERPLELGQACLGAGMVAARVVWAWRQQTIHDAPDVGLQFLARQRQVAAVQRQCLLRSTTTGQAHLQAQSVALPVHHVSLHAEPVLWETAHPLTGLRAAAGEWLEAYGWEAAKRSVLTVGNPLGDARPVRRLHVSHSWGGGLAKWIRDFITADQAAGLGDNWVLRSIGIFGAFGQRVALFKGTEEVVPVQFWELGVPIHASATAHLQVQHILEEIRSTYGIEQMVVSSLIGHSLDVLRTGLPTVVVAHDHYPYCVALYAHFEQECRSCDGQRLRQCLARNPDHRFFGGVRADDWEELRRAFVQTLSEEGLPVVAPVASVADRWRSMMPDLSPVHFHVIGHGLDLPAVSAPEETAPLAAPRKLRVLVLGRLTLEKGAGLLETMAPELLKHAELVLLGCGEAAAKTWSRPGVECRANYQPDELMPLLQEARADVGLLMSTVPETFSYALSELWHARIPVVATRSGALADRITDGVNGYLEPADADALLARLLALKSKPEALRAMRQRLAQQTHPRVVEMVQAYDRLLVRKVALKGEAGELAATSMGPSLVVQSATPCAHPLEWEARPAYASFLQVNPQATWRQVARAFWQYTWNKAAQSPRVPSWLRERLRAWRAA